MDTIAYVLMIVDGCIVWYAGYHMEIPKWGKIIFYIGAFLMCLDGVLALLHILH